VDPKAFSWNKTMSPTSSVSLPSDCQTLDEIYTNVISFVRTRCKKILDLTHQAFRGTHYDILTDVMLIEITAAVVKRVHVIFNPGIPDTFQTVFITQLNECTSVTRILELPGHSTIFT
jgi:hypothetical protein